jgi:hypothetical protein
MSFADNVHSCAPDFADAVKSQKQDGTALKPNPILMAMAACMLPATSQAASVRDDPIRFFEGRTESIGTVKIAMKKPFRSRTVGKGEIMSDGSLNLVQRVEDEGHPARERRWRMRKVGNGRYTGTMSEAKGPVTVDELDGRYRFRFRMDSSVSVEQWLTPAADGRSAKSNTTFKKFGISVGKSDALIRKVD